MVLQLQDPRLHRELWSLKFRQKYVIIVVVWLKAPTSAVADSSKWPGPTEDDVSSIGGSKLHLCSRKLFPSGLARWKENV